MTEHQQFVQGLQLLGPYCQQFNISAMEHCYDVFYFHVILTKPVSEILVPLLKELDWEVAENKLCCRFIINN